MAGDRFFDHGPVFLKDVRLDYHDLYKPKAPKGQSEDKAKFRIKAIIYRGTEAEKLAKEAILAAARKAWGDNAGNVFRALGKNEKAVRNGDEYLRDDGSVRPEYAGQLFISASNKAQPRVVAQRKFTGTFKDMQGNTHTVPADKPAFIDIGPDGSAWVNGKQMAVPPYKITVPYRGCRVNLKLTFVAMRGGEMSGGEKVSNQVYAKIEAVQFARDDDAFGPGAASAEGFDDEEVADGDLFGADSNGGMEDDIPF